MVAGLTIFQWFLCAGVWVSGFALHVANGFPGLERSDLIRGLIGGAAWALANYLVVPVMQLIGSNHRL